MHEPAGRKVRSMTERPDVQEEHDFLSLFAELFCTPCPEDKTARCRSDNEADMLFHRIAANLRMRSYFDRSLSRINTGTFVGVADSERDRSGLTWMNHKPPGQASQYIDADEELYRWVGEFVQARHTLLAILRDEAARQRKKILLMIAESPCNGSNDRTIAAAKVES